MAMVATWLRKQTAALQPIHKTMKPIEIAETTHLKGEALLVRDQGWEVVAAVWVAGGADNQLWSQSNQLWL
jgi:hypothetical protein